MRLYDVKIISKRYLFRVVYKVIRIIVNVLRIIGILWWCVGRYFCNLRVNDLLYRNKVDCKFLFCEDGWKGDVF